MPLSICAPSVYFTQFLGSNSQSFPFYNVILLSASAFVHPFHCVVQGVQLDINLPQMSPTHQTAHGCLSGIG